MRKLLTYLVEDNPTIRAQLIETLVELANVECVGFADNETDAVNWLREHPQSWELALVDLFLKQGSGMGVVSALAKRGADKKLVVVSNYATRDVSQRCRELGCDGVFDKSGDIDDLIQFCKSM